MFNKNYLLYEIIKWDNSGKSNHQSWSKKMNKESNKPLRKFWLFSKVKFLLMLAKLK